MEGLISRASQIEADNGVIAEGQLPLEYGVRYEPADEVIVVTESKDEQRIEFTVASFVRIVAEANHARGLGNHLLKRIKVACGE